MAKSKIFDNVSDTDFTVGGSGGVCLFLAALNVPLHSLCADSSYGPALSYGSSTTSCETLTSYLGALGRERRTALPHSSPPPPRTTHGTCSLCREQGPSTWAASAEPGRGAPHHCAATSTCVSTSTVGENFHLIQALCVI